MGTVYLIPDIGNLDFTSMGGNPLIPYNQLDGNQQIAFNAIKNNGLQLTGVAYIEQYFATNNGGHYIATYAIDNTHFGVIFKHDTDDKIYRSFLNSEGEASVVWYNSGTGISNYEYNGVSLLDSYNNYDDCYNAIAGMTLYPIRYTANNCTLSAPSTASPGQDVVININPATGYSFRGASGVSIVDSYGDNVPYIVNGNQIAFTMPQP